MKMLDSVPILRKMATKVLLGSRWTLRLKALLSTYKLGNGREKFVKKTEIFRYYRLKEVVIFKFSLKSFVFLKMKIYIRVYIICSTL